MGRGEEEGKGWARVGGGRGSAEKDGRKHTRWLRPYANLRQQFVPFLIEQHAKGNFPMDQFVTFYDVKDYKQALEDAHKGKAIKAVLKW